MIVRLSIAAFLVLTVAAQAQEAATRVLILPFNALAATDQAGDAGASIQQTLAAELARMSGVHPITTTVKAGPITAQAATDAANNAQAHLVIYGSHHLHNHNLRITGQILDVQTNRFIGGLKATGAARDLFALQDIIAQQTRRILSQRTTPETGPTAEPSEAPPHEPQRLIKPLGPVKGARAWQTWNPIPEPSRAPIANRDDFERVSHAYRYTHGAPIYRFYPVYIHVPRAYHRYRRCW
jgi:TolB-like protein